MLEIKSQYRTMLLSTQFEVPRYRGCSGRIGGHYWMANAAKVALGVNKNAMWMTMAVRDITSWTGHIAQGHESGPGVKLRWNGIAVETVWEFNGYQQGNTHWELRA